MATALPLDRALERLRAKAQDDEALAETIEFLVDEGVLDPWCEPDDAVLDAARMVNRSREERRRIDFMRRALDTPDVVEIIGSISDRKAVDRRRKRGTLLGMRVGRRTLHPDWQFDRRRGTTWTGLDRLLDALAGITDDPLVADAIMTTRRRDLDGRSIADIFSEGHIDLAVRLVQMADDQS